MKRFLGGALAALLVLAGAGLAVALTGAYDVAATTPHTALGRWVLETTSRNSIVRQAADIRPPSGFTDGQVSQGAHHYKESCVYCHGAPGEDSTDWASGMRPEPPYLPEAVGEWSDAQLFWIVKHGIKMSAMPAFGSHHGDEDIWAIVAFIKTLPGMSPEQYRALGG
ncbi:cytochrome c [Roseomonas sp. M0104]|uniref:Cytochrome c n=1 Tax=Teichococcus coralli TaxID=2545983 RepID=A0A845BGU0_9PROT|nr:cytochrome c [Pseudoroseomonas coralli]MXP65300.1 cytochrome c [Pseudoroseomonas coralli]